MVILILQQSHSVVIDINPVLKMPDCEKIDHPRIASTNDCTQVHIIMGSTQQQSGGTLRFFLDGLKGLKNVASFWWEESESIDLGRIGGAEIVMPCLDIAVG